MNQVVESHVVSVERSIRLGAGYTIVPSEAFQGIDKGNVKVYRIAGYDALDITDQGMADEWIMSMDVLDENDIAMEWKNNLWVVYDYTDRKTDHVEIMPIDVFAHHVVPRY